MKLFCINKTSLKFANWNLVNLEPFSVPCVHFISFACCYEESWTQRIQSLFIFVTRKKTPCTCSGESRSVHMSLPSLLIHELCNLRAYLYSIRSILSFICLIYPSPTTLHKIIFTLVLYNLLLNHESQSDDEIFVKVKEYSKYLETWRSMHHLFSNSLFLTKVFI